MDFGRIAASPGFFGALLTTFPGDVTMAHLEEVEAFAKGGSARVQRQLRCKRGSRLSGNRPG